MFDKLPSFYINIKSDIFWRPHHSCVQKGYRHLKAKGNPKPRVTRQVKQNLFESEGENLRDTGEWAQFELYRQGQKSERNCKKAPITCKLVSSIPQVASNRRGQVKFSVMASGTHVHAHSGPTNCRLRVHLGLKIPIDEQKGEQPGSSVSSRGKTFAEDATKLRVADRYLKWGDGEIFIFDDSFDHEVWHYNRQQESRVVLILDLWHPDLNAYQRQTLPAI